LGNGVSRKVAFVIFLAFSKYRPKLCGLAIISFQNTLTNRKFKTLHLFQSRQDKNKFFELIISGIIIENNNILLLYKAMFQTY